MKNQQMGSLLIKKLLHSKKNYQQSEETTYSVGKHFYQLLLSQRITIENTQKNMKKSDFQNLKTQSKNEDLK